MWMEANSALGRQGGSRIRSLINPEAVDKLYERRCDFMPLGWQGTQTWELTENKESQSRFFCPPKPGN
jgi:hypothetical protein